MKIDRVTFTGADNNTNIDKLISISKDNPFIEWGILFSLSKEGTNRYPSPYWVKEIIKSNLNLSAHLCGEFSRQIIERKNYHFLSFLKKFNRVQINYNFNNKKKHYINNLINYAVKNNKIIILQYNNSNSNILDKYQFPENFNFLYDLSGGRGVEITNINNPLYNYTGYAGGLNNYNIEKIVKLIENKNNNKNVWIDFESGVRSNNEFSIRKVNNILKKLKDPCISKSFVNNRCLEEDFEFYERHSE